MDTLLIKKNGTIDTDIWTIQHEYAYAGWHIIIIASMLQVCPSIRISGCLTFTLVFPHSVHRNNVLPAWCNFSTFRATKRDPQSNCYFNVLIHILMQCAVFLVEIKYLSTVSFISWTCNIYKWSEKSIPLQGRSRDHYDRRCCIS